MQDIKNLIVIGASAGGLGAISQVLSGLSDNLDAAVLVVIHISRKSNAAAIASVFQRKTNLVCVPAQDGMHITKGHLYVALPDHHLMVSDGHIRINQGPHENKYRPSIDVLFRSAAVNYGNRVIGIILTGLLEDGTSGMYAIKQTGGICIVQDPDEAEFSDMPRSVLNKIKVDHCATLDDIPGILQRIIAGPLPEQMEVPNELQIEADITERMMTDINEMKKIADRSDFMCPDCGGGLWAVKNDPIHRYRCHTGHVYTEKLLNELKDEKIEESIWVCLRMLEEKANLLMLMSHRESNEGKMDTASAHQRRVDDINRHISRLKSFLTRLSQDLYDTPPAAE